MQTAHIDKFTNVWKMGTKTIPQVCETNWPAVLHTATAILILEQQQNSINKKNPLSPKQVYPKISLVVVEVPSTVGILIHETELLEITPALYKNMTPPTAKHTMIPIDEVQTINPAKHFKVYIKMKENMTAKPKAQSNHCQF